MNQVFESNFSMGEDVLFVPMFKHSQEMGIAQEEMYGTIVAVRFTKAKVFYDVVDDYYGKVFDNISSNNVFSNKTVGPPGTI